MTIINNWIGSEEFILINVSVKREEDIILVCLAFLGLGIVIGFKV